MTSRFDEHDIARLYQQRKQAVRVPDAIQASIMAEPAKPRFSFAKALAIFAMSGGASFAIFALISHFATLPLAHKQSRGTARATSIEVQLQPAANKPQVEIILPTQQKITPPTPPTAPDSTITRLPTEPMTTPAKLPAIAIPAAEKMATVKPTQNIYVLSKVLPSYPSSATARHQQAKVTLAYHIDEQGQVQNIRLVGSQVAPAFSRAAIKALKQWRYHVPGELPANWQEQELIVEFDFKLAAD